MKIKATLIFKSGFKHEIEYVWNDIINIKEVENIFTDSFGDDNNAFIIKDDVRVDYYVKSEIAHLSIENVGSN